MGAGRYSPGAFSPLMQIVPYSFYLYTVFHSVIFNSVTKGYETAVPENIQTDSALYWIEHNLTLCSALSCPVKNLIVFANVQKNANNVVAYVFMSKKQFDQSKELPETENIIFKCPEKLEYPPITHKLPTSVLPAIPEQPAITVCAPTFTL